MKKNMIYSKAKSEEEKIKSIGILAWIVLIFSIILIVFLDSLIPKKTVDEIDYKKASFVYNEYICTQKEYIEELKEILYFKFGDTIYFCEYESKIDSLENTLDEMYSVNKRDL